MSNNVSFIIIVFSAYCFLLSGCTEPVEPEFEFRSNLVTIESIVTTSIGVSFVTIKESVVERNRYSNIPVNEAVVSLLNSNTGTVVMFSEEDGSGVYVPPMDFVASVGDTWELDVLLSDGRNYKSLPETIVEPVYINSISATYDPELVFDIGFDRFLPGHSIEVGFNDPLGQENFYYWSFRSFELKDLCAICSNSHIYRDGTCIPVDPYPNFPESIVPYYSYRCENECWRIRYNENINIWSDEFTNGNSTQLAIADVLLYNKKDILVEVQQVSLSAEAFRYFQTLKDLVDNNGGFNSPPPAALIGNMFNPADSEEFVLGRFTAAPTDIARIFIERDQIVGPEIEAEIEEVTEEDRPPPGVAPEDWVFYVSCPEENRYNTSFRPVGWPN
nr:DUF4249 domain-containing protein [uncultured Allomuricauda sp.]